MQASWICPWKRHSQSWAESCNSQIHQHLCLGGASATKVWNAATVGHTHTGTGGHQKTFHLWGNKDRVYFMRYPNLHEKASWGRDHQQAQGPELLLPLQGCRLKNCAFAPRSLWVQKEEKQSPSLTENRLREELFTNCCAAFSTRYLPPRPAESPWAE